LNFSAVSTIFVLNLGVQFIIHILLTGTHVLSDIHSLIISCKAVHIGRNIIAQSLFHSLFFSIIISAKKSSLGEFFIISSAVGSDHARLVKYGDTTFALASCCHHITSHNSAFSSILISISSWICFCSSENCNLTTFVISSGFIISGLSHL
jgi:hypothetical protein